MPKNESVPSGNHDDVDFDERWWFTKRETPPPIDPGQHFEIADGVYKAKGADPTPPTEAID